MTAKKNDNYWRKLYGQAQANLSGVSKAQLRVQLYETLEQFFELSNCWTETLAISVVPEAQEYKLYPAQGRVLRLLSVVDQYGSVQPAIMPTVGTVLFQYPYTQTQTMYATVVKTVNDPLCCYPPYIPDWVLPVHGVGIQHGLIGGMMLMPGQSYSNTQMANYHLQKFRDKCAHARVAASKANTVGAQAWAFPQQFRASSQRGGVSTFNVHPTTTR